MILKFVDFNKIIFSCLRGGIVTPFFGLSLASNFRFATEEMSYMLAHRKFGLHPTGALPFFLKHYVSWSKQNEILYQLEDIKAAEAKALGMIDKIFPDEDFEARCLDEVNRIVELNRGSACQTRLLMGFPISDLINYFDREGLFI